MFNKILKLSIMLVALISFIGTSAIAHAGVLDAEYTGVVTSEEALNRNTATISDENLSKSTSNQMGVEFYCMVRDAIEGDLGLTIGFLVALYGLFLFVLKGESFGIVVMLVGVAFTFTPSLLESTISGMSKLSGSEPKADIWMLVGGCDNLEEVSVEEKPVIGTANSGDKDILAVQPPLFVDGWKAELGLNESSSEPSTSSGDHGEVAGTDLEVDIAP